MKNTPEPYLQKETILYSCQNVNMHSDRGKSVGLFS